MKRSLVALLSVCLAAGCLWGDTVSFTLKIADRAIPDMRGYEALWLTGEGFKRENEIGLGKTYGWYARALQTANLDWKLSYDGYADKVRIGEGRSYGYDLPGNTLTNETTALCQESERWRREKKLEGVSKSMLIGVISGCQPNGAPHAWELPDYETPGDCEAIVWRGVFYDLAARFGTAERRKRILAVSSEYDRGTRFCLGYRVPTLRFEDENKAFRQIYSDGVGGETIAELHVKFPGRFFGGAFRGNDRAEWYFHPSVFGMVLQELQKPENRGKTICGQYTYARGVGTLRIDGRMEKASSPATKAVFDGKNIPPRAYANCFNREFPDDVFPAGIKTIGTCAFAGCGMFGFERGTIRLPDGLASIGEGAFRGCWHLTGIEIPDSVTNIGTWAFCECHGLAQVRLPKRLVEIPDGLFCRTSFEWSKGLERVEIPPGVKRVGKYAFAGCVGLKEVVIPDSVEVIDDYAFYGCKILVRPKLPPSVRMGKHVFE